MKSKMNGDIICPFNKDHAILKERFQFHLVRCSLQNLHINIVKCPFNSTHLLKHKDLFDHLDEKCENRIVFERSLQSLCDFEIPIGVVPTNFEVPLPTNDEDWDDEIPIIPVKEVIQVNVNNKPVLRNLVGRCSSQRKQHKAAERERHAKINKKR